MGFHKLGAFFVGESGALYIRVYFWASSIATYLLVPHSYFSKVGSLKRGSGLLQRRG